jgi:hypothetical protein
VRRLQIQQRNSFRYASRKDWPAIAKDLKPIYTAATEAAALDRFAEFSERWESRYPAVVKLWEKAWAEFVPFLSFDQEIRTIIYTTNAIESVNSRIRKVVKARGKFSNSDAAFKCVYLAIMSIDLTGGGPSTLDQSLEAGPECLYNSVPRPYNSCNRVTEVIHKEPNQVHRYCDTLLRLARRQFEVVDIVEVLQHWHAGRPKSVVASSLGIDDKTVRKYVARLRRPGCHRVIRRWGGASGRSWWPAGSRSWSTPVSAWICAMRPSS